MSDLPPAIGQYLETLGGEARHPAWFGFGEGHIRSLGGAVYEYGLGALALGDAFAKVDFLHGLLPLNGQAHLLPRVSIGSVQRCADIHLIPGDDCDWVLLLDSTIEANQQRFIQQMGNDLALLRERMPLAARMHVGENNVMADLLGDLLATMDILVLDHVGGDGSSDGWQFHVIGALPHWAQELFPEAASPLAVVDPCERFPFIESFLPDAQVHWDSQSNTHLRSDVWTEPAGGVDYHLKTAALCVGEHRLLLIYRNEKEFEDKQKVFQKARQNRLDFDRDIALANKKTKSAEQVAKERAQFLADMSHELRSPLNSILGYSDLLEEEARASGDASSVSDLKRIHSAGAHLLSLINDVLDLSKTEAGRMPLNLEAFDIAGLVQDVVNTAAPLMVKNGNTLAVDCPAAVGSMTADATKLRQTLINLLSNAAKFTQKGTVRLTAQRRTENGADWIIFAVNDTGIGMTPEQAGRLFQAYVQAEKTTSKTFGGTGLGLALCRKYCQMMGGEVSVASEPGKGSTFTVKLPAKVIEPPQVA